MDIKRYLTRRLAGMILILIVSAAAAVNVSAMIWDRGHCSNNVIDCRGTICYYGCGGIAWQETWCKLFGGC